MTKGILKPITIKNRTYKKMWHSKDPFNKRELENKVKKIQESAT